MVETLTFPTSLEGLSKLQLDKVEGFDHYALEYQANRFLNYVVEYLTISACDANGDVITQREYNQTYTPDEPCNTFDIITQIGRETIKPGSEVVLVLYPKQALKITSKDLGLFEIYSTDPFTEVNLGPIFTYDLTSVSNNESKSVTVLYRPNRSSCYSTGLKPHELPNIQGTYIPPEMSASTPPRPIPTAVEPQSVLDKPLPKVEGQVTTIGADEHLKNPNVPHTVEDIATILAQTAAAASAHVQSVKSENVVNTPEPTKEEKEAQHKAALDSFDANMKEFMDRMKEGNNVPINLDEVREEEAREEIVADEVATTPGGSTIPVVTIKDAIKAGKVKGKLPEVTPIEKDNGVEPLSEEDDFDFSSKK